MAEAPRPRRQKGICVICGKPIGEGEGVRRIILLGEPRALLTHPKCHDRDWEPIESGFEHFPVRFAELYSRDA